MEPGMTHNGPDAVARWAESVQANTLNLDRAVQEIVRAARDCVTFEAFAEAIGDIGHAGVLPETAEEPDAVSPGTFVASGETLGDLVRVVRYATKRAHPGSTPSVSAERLEAELRRGGYIS
jgi:hypothetical protein